MTLFIVLSLAITFLLVLHKRIREYMFIRGMRKYNERKRRYACGKAVLNVTLKKGVWYA